MSRLSWLAASTDLAPNAIFQAYLGSSTVACICVFRVSTLEPLIASWALIIHSLNMGIFALSWNSIMPWMLRFNLVFTTFANSRFSTFIFCWNCRICLRARFVPMFPDQFTDSSGEFSANTWRPFSMLTRVLDGSVA